MEVYGVDVERALQGTGVAEATTSRWWAVVRSSLNVLSSAGWKSSSRRCSPSSSRPTLSLWRWRCWWTTSTRSGRRGSRRPRCAPPWLACRTTTRSWWLTTSSSSSRGGGGGGGRLLLESTTWTLTEAVVYMCMSHTWALLHTKQQGCFFWWSAGWSSTNISHSYICTCF